MTVFNSFFPAIIRQEMYCFFRLKLFIKVTWNEWENFYSILSKKILNFHHFRNKYGKLSYKIEIQGFFKICKSNLQQIAHKIQLYHKQHIFAYYFYRRKFFYLNICMFCYYHPKWIATTFRCILQNIWSQNTLYRALNTCMHALDENNSILDRHKINLFIHYLLSIINIQYCCFLST